MNPIPIARLAAFALTAFALGGCYYTSPYGYAPYYAPAPATLSQREAPVVPGDAASSPPQAEAAPSYAPAYAAPAVVPYPYYPYYYGPYYPGYYDYWGWPPVSLGFGFGFGGGFRGGRGHSGFHGGGHGHWEGMHGGGHGGGRGH
ncbi:conserved protein of unknown function [Burkholderia multivorans]